jgi:type VI protein secretion system component Hcp
MFESGLPMGTGTRIAGVAEKPTVLYISKAIDKASPGLFRAYQHELTFPRAVLTLIKLINGSEVPLLVANMTGVTVPLPPTVRPIEGTGMETVTLKCKDIEIVPSNIPRPNIRK